MRLKARLRVLPLFWGMAGCLAAQAPAWAASPDCADPQSQMALDQCALQDFKAADANLGATYRQVMARLKGNPDQAKLLVHAQRAWLAFRDADCAFQGSGVAGGSAYPMIVTQCRTLLTTQRTGEIKSWLNCQEGDLSCPLN
jgi:uncharacterized protein YecT (DUF1311 family)